MDAAIGVGSTAGAGNGGMDAGGKIANGKGGTFVGKFPTAAGVTGGVVLGAGAVVGPVGAAAGVTGGVVLGAGAVVEPVGAATAPTRKGLLPLLGTVFVGVDARGAIVGRLMGRVTTVGEGSPGFVGGQGKPAMR